VTDGFDLEALLGSAAQMQQQLMAAQQAAAAEVVEGQAGGGVVKVRVTGGLEFEAVEIAPAAIDSDDPQMLQDLVLAALHDAMARVQELQQQAMGGFDPSNIDLGGLLGAPPDEWDDDEDDEDDDEDEEEEDGEG
jgi:DNA-binding YbaB/EbfC family protein